jgi:hypothetical protein
VKETFKLPAVFIIIATMISCNSSVQKNKENNIADYNQIEKASWLIGAWENNSAEGYSAESWEKKNDSAYAGKSYFIIGKDTVSSETISLEQHGGQLFYIPTLKDQNAGQAVKFTLTASTNTQLVFENPAHDFPQKLSYTQINKDSLLAEISGMQHGKYRAEKFPMQRAQ